ncbi:hypothetical protein [Modicisalibacter luteus]|jgi:hypothetical protein|uniref:Uncharacterized protein n=1 Tax=Modicisalibacter luteus TaxID=453962 RepID=A0ABV7LWD8_9GAMM|nr:hypothetical protein [Halomonas lutea]GHB11603.1 hypothetical protein GCM10007159_37280 [Halomonas lutea]
MGKSFDPLRALAIASQAFGFVLIIILETWLEDEARPWQGVTLGIMLLVALSVALMRLYRRNKARKAAAERARKDSESCMSD